MSNTNVSNTGTNEVTPERDTKRSDEVSAAEELATLRAGIAREQAGERERFTGWKPLTIWYTVWALLIGFVSVKALFAGQFGTFMIGAVVTSLTCLYVKYLYGGGKHRVWFFVF